MSQALRVMVGGRVVFNTRANLLSFAILEQRRLCACSLKDLPPTQLCEGRVSSTVDLGAIGSGASTQQHSKSCLIVREGGRVFSPAKGCGCSAPRAPSRHTLTPRHAQSPHLFKDQPFQESARHSPPSSWDFIAHDKRDHITLGHTFFRYPGMALFSAGGVVVIHAGSCLLAPRTQQRLWD